MDFKLSEQQRELQEIARNFAQNEMIEVALSVEETGEPLSKGWLKKYSEMGFLGINVSDKYGGLGLSNLDAIGSYPTPDAETQVIPVSNMFDKEISRRGLNLRTGAR